MACSSPQHALAITMSECSLSWYLSESVSVDSTDQSSDWLADRIERPRCYLAMTSLTVYGRVLAAAAFCSFLGGLAYLRHTQSGLVLEPRVKHPAAPALSADAVIAIGDLHGDLEQGKTALRLAGLINVYDSWIGGTATLVQTGDLLDRGPNSLSLVDLFESLKVRPAEYRICLSLMKVCMQQLSS